MITKRPEQQLEPKTDFIRTCEIDGYFCTGCEECKPTCDEDYQLRKEEESTRNISEESLINTYYSIYGKESVE